MSFRHRGIFALFTLGLHASLSSATPQESAGPATANRAPPAEIDLRPMFEQWGLAVRPQGPRGTCSVFTVTGALEFARARRHGDGVPLSVEYLNWASNDAIHDATDGGFFSDLWKGFEAHGVCPDSDQPYAATFDPGLKPAEPATRHAAELRGDGYELHWIKPWDVTTGLTDAHLAEIKATLARRWPVCGGFRWPKAEQWNDGVLQFAPPEGVRDGHSVLLVGYRDDAHAPGGGTFVFRNSGNPKMDGRMTYEYAKAYMNDAAWIGFDEAKLKSVPATQPTSPGRAASPARGTGDSLAAPLSRDVMSLISPLSPAPSGRNRRVSSNQQPDWHTENLDMTWLQPGQSVEMPLLEGPGVITHMWFTSHAGWAAELNALSLQIYWDGGNQPGVEVPLGDFFAVGQGKPAVVESVPVQVSPTGALTCYWRMPFAKSARIVVTNDNPERGAGLYWQVDWTQVESLPPDTPRFYAAFRAEYPAVAGHDYRLADLTGRGIYVGTVISVTQAQDGWFGEGDDFFYIDGESVPSLQGTGSEDYFNDAWGFRPRTSHWFGTPRWQGDSAGDSGICYRWHLPDAVNFSRSLRVAIEHKGNRNADIEAFYVERPDFLSSVAYWYQCEPPPKMPKLPAWNERRVPWQSVHFVRAFRDIRQDGDAPLKIDTAGLFGARPTLLWANKKPGATLTIPFELERGGRSAVRLIAGASSDAGTFDIELDGQRITTASFRAADQPEIDLLLGTREIAAGKHKITFRASAAENAVGPLTIEMLRILNLPPEANRTIRTHNEAHFIRLAIGRAVYAYRLAYGEVPDSLQRLVDVGILGERYLRDENDKPLKSRRDGDALIVETSDTPGEPWTHRWQGLDARR